MLYQKQTHLLKQSGYLAKDFFRHFKEPSISNAAAPAGREQSKLNSALMEEEEAEDSLNLVEKIEGHQIQIRRLIDSVRER